MEEIEKKESEQKKKEIVLPEVGTKFMVNGNEYEVVYINEGRKRFTAVPCEGMY